MVYTVKKLAEFSGVSIRTLHFYDEIELLKPAYYGENNYRYYEEEQLLILQQILLYRELGFPLDAIKKIIFASDFDKVIALESHKKNLQRNLDQAQKLIKTIDKTIAHLRGKAKMKEKEFYYGFDSEKQKQHEKYLVENGIVTQEFLNECNKKIKNWTDNEKNQYIQNAEEIYDSLIMALTENFDPSSEEVQNLISKHYQWLKKSWTPTKEAYVNLIQLYQTPAFKEFFDHRHPKLLEFMVKAMEIFSQREFF